MSIFSMLIDLPPDGQFGVGQPAAQTARPSSAFTGTFRHSEPSLWSRVVGVGQPASGTVSSNRPRGPFGLSPLP